MTSILSTPVTKALNAFGSFVDNVIESSSSDLNLTKIFKAEGITKKLGAPPQRILMAAIHAPLVMKDSAWAFCERFLQQYQIGKKDVIYRFLERQDIRWAKITTKLSDEFNKYHEADIFGHEDEVAAVFDDTLTNRFGKKVEASAKHYDHGIKRSIRSHQVVAAGISFCKGYVPLAAQIVCGEKDRYERTHKFEDGRSEVAKAYDRSLSNSKNDFFAQMVKRIARTYHKRIKWVVADAWFGSKCNIKAVLDAGFHGVILMKRNKLKYRYQGKLLDAKELYKLFKRRMTKVKGGLFRGIAIEVEIDLGDPKSPDWRKVQLIMSRPVNNHHKNGWIVCVCTDLEASMEKVLKVYSLRWSIEVFFKECKQNMGWLNNQSGNYVSTYASLHLSTIRYILLQHAALIGGSGLCQVRRKTCDQLIELNYLGRIWPILMELVFGILGEMKQKYGTVIEQIATDLRQELGCFIEQAFRIEENIPEAFPEEELCATGC